MPLPPAPPDAAAPPRRSKPPLLPIIVIAVLGLAALAGGAVPIAVDLTRKPTAAEVRAAEVKELGDRWRILTAGEIFPERVEVRARDRFMKEMDPPALTAVRAGIAPEASCAAAFDAGLARVLAKHGCRTALRATYLDGSGTLAVTVGIAVMPDARRASQAEADFGSTLGVSGGKERYGVRAVPVPGTAAAAFGDQRRRSLWFDTNGTPYLFFRSSGWLTDRGGPPLKATDPTFRFAEAALDKIAQTFAANTDVCERRGVRC
ncbi:hypothetical protein ACFY4C_30110 [Actinomadura viridis]|uniref:hypothetical protein n=1 Tax=Actinomadura viridis TaxID=58110 RepID=UPI0036C1553D